MRKVLAITAALMIAAMVLMPALGYTNQAAGNQSYSIKSGERIAYSLTTQAPAHNLTPGMIADKYSVKAPAVSSTRMPYSFKLGAATTYSLKLIGVENAAPQGVVAKKPTALLGSMNEMGTTEAAEEKVTAPMNETVTAPMNETVTAPMNETVTAPMNETVTAPMNETVTAPMNETVNLTTNATTNSTLVVPINVTKTVTN